MFNPKVGLELIINGITYHIAEHPAAPGMPYGQAGRRAVVYQLENGKDKRALKVFKLRYRSPSLTLVAQKLAPYASLPGLQVCERTVITPERHASLLQQYPDLTYAVLMPWIEGETWMETMLRKDAPSDSPPTPEESLALAMSLAEILATMEEQGLAHCDLSGPNVMLLPGNSIALVDVEEMYGKEFPRPEILSSGTGGYAHQRAVNGIWGSEADRFTGAVLLAEMLGWCDERIRQAAWGESYFEPDEMQQDTERYRLLENVLRKYWGKWIAETFQEAWFSEQLEDCPSAQIWMELLLAEKQEAKKHRSTNRKQPSDASHTEEVTAVGGILEETARNLYRTLQEQVSLGNWEEVSRIGRALEALHPNYRDVRSILNQAEQGQAQEQAVQEEIKRKEKIISETELRLKQEQRDLDEQQHKLDEKQRELNGHKAALQQQWARLDQERQSLDEARQLLAAHRWKDAQQKLQPVTEPPPSRPQPLKDEEPKRQAKKKVTVPTNVTTASPVPHPTVTGWTKEQIRTLKEIRRIKPPRQRRGLTLSPVQVRSVAFSPNGAMLASATDSGMVQLWRVPDGKLLHTLKGHTSWVLSVAFSPDGQLIASGSADKTVRVWQTNGELSRILNGHRVTSVNFSPDGKLLTSASLDTTIHLWRISDGRLLHTLGHTSKVRCVTFSPDGTMIASAESDKTVRLWRVSDGALLRTLQGHTDGVYSVAFSPNGDLLASASRDRTVRLWQASDGRLLRMLEVHTSVVTSVAFSPDGQIVASGAWDDTVRLWKVDDGTLLRTLKGHTDGVTSVTFSPNGEMLASGSLDGTIRLWGKVQ